METKDTQSPLVGEGLQMSSGHGIHAPCALFPGSFCSLSRLSALWDAFLD